jgi:hypothetical protein
MLQQVSNPLSIFDVRFPSRYRFDMLCINQEELHLLLFQHIPDGLPKHPRRLHGYRLALLGFEPITQAVEILQHCAERLDFFLNPLSPYR